MQRTPRYLASLLAVFCGLGGIFATANIANAATSLTISSIGWNVVGLDSNDVNSGPERFPQAYKVCNTSGSAATNVEADWEWTTANALVSLDGDTNRKIGTIAANSCVQVYWTVKVTRDEAAYDTSRKYRVSVKDDAAANATTPELLVYVEHLISQNRNVVDGVTGPTAVSVGDVVQFVMTGATATQGYEQIVTAPILSSSIFEITNVSGTYKVGGSVNTFYYDACKWDPAGTDKTNWECLATGKAGGAPITITVSAKVIGTGTTYIGGIIYDFSGSSFHYNSDYSTGVLEVTSTEPVKSVAAVDDSATTDVDVPVEIDVLGNDFARLGVLDKTSVIITQQPLHGSLSIDPVTGVVTYTPDPGYSGPDSFKYTVAIDGDATIKDEATVTITIPEKRIVDEKTIDPGEPLVIDPTTVDPTGPTIDPTTVEITQEPTSGTTSVDPTTGVITYTPPPGFTGEVTIKFRATTADDPTKYVEYSYTVTVGSGGETGGLAETGFDALTTLALAFAMILLGAGLTLVGRRLANS